MRRTLIFNLLPGISALQLAACASSSSSITNYHKLKPAVAKLPSRVLPGGNDDNWRYLGLSQNRQLAVEINESSITSGAEWIKYQDRKTVVNPANFDYQGLTPPYKYSWGWWQINCNTRTYTIDHINLYDSYGNLLKSYALNGQAHQQWSNISHDSIGQLEYDYICNGVKRQLGY